MYGKRKLFILIQFNGLAHRCLIIISHWIWITFKYIQWVTVAACKTFEIKILSIFSLYISWFSEVSLSSQTDYVHYSQQSRNFSFLKTFVPFTAEILLIKIFHTPIRTIQIFSSYTLTDLLATVSPRETWLDAFGLILFCFLKYKI